MTLPSVRVLLERCKWLRPREKPSYEPFLFQQEITTRQKTCQETGKSFISSIPLLQYTRPDNKQSEDETIKETRQEINTELLVLNVNVSSDRCERNLFLKGARFLRFKTSKDLLQDRILDLPRRINYNHRRINLHKLPITWRLIPTYFPLLNGGRCQITKLHKNHTNNFAKIDNNWFTLNPFFTQITTRQKSPDFYLFSIYDFS